MVDKSKIRVKVIDDDPFMLRLLTKMLAIQGITNVTTCNNGRTALISLALGSLNNSDRGPNLILLDLNMPEIDGIEFVRLLVERSYTGSLILISGEDERILQTVEKLAKAHKVDVLGYIRKPFKPEALSDLLDKWTPHHQVSPQSSKKVYDAAEVRSAIENGELVNYYQPKVSLATGEVVGVETLVRWLHPKNGIVYPDQFIGVAEEHGLIDDLTRVVLMGALTQVKAWKDKGLMLQVSVNVSFDNLTSLDFADFVEAEAAAARVAPQDLMLEVTESRLMLDARAPLETLTRLSLKRFRLSIDDFGTGHSSLVQLRNIPFNELKIDRGFVHNAWADETARAIYDASLGLAKQLGMQSVAEGVEDRNDWDFLRRTGCEFAQGYYIAKPMPAADLLGWIESWQKQESGDIAARR